MRLSEFNALTSKLKTAVNGKDFSHFSYGNIYCLQENKPYLAQAFSVSFVADNTIHVNFYSLHELYVNKRGASSYKYSKNVSNEYYSLTDKQINALNDLFYNLYKLKDL